MAGVDVQRFRLRRTGGVGAAGTQRALGSHESETTLMHSNSNPLSASPVQAARVAIWRLFEEGYVDEDMATAGLLAVDVGTRRRRNGGAERRLREPGVGGGDHRRDLAA